MFPFFLHKIREQNTEKSKVPKCRNSTEQPNGHTADQASLSSPVPETLKSFKPLGLWMMGGVAIEWGDSSDLC
jgi:hypothetical protein